MRKFLLDMVTSSTGVSSKRITGVLGWLVCLVICLFCTFKNVLAPDITEWLFICSSSLLGLDTISKTVTRSINKNNLSSEMKKL